MNKKFVEENIGKAKAAIEEMPGLLDDKKQLDKTMRSKMAAFGAAVYMSGLRPAIAYYTKNEVNVIKLLSRMYTGKYDENLFDKIPNDFRKMQEVRDTILGYAVCLKLAMNLFELKENENGGSN